MGGWVGVNKDLQAGGKEDCFRGRMPLLSLDDGLWEWLPSHEIQSIKFYNEKKE
jgi:hypothetical protein